MIIQFGKLYKTEQNARNIQYLPISYKETYSILLTGYNIQQGPFTDMNTNAIYNIWPTHFEYGTYNYTNGFCWISIGY